MAWLCYLVAVLHLDHGVHCKGMFGCGVPPNRAVVLATPPGVALGVSVVLACPTRLGCAALLVAACTKTLLARVGRFYEIHVVHVFAQRGVVQPNWPLISGVYIGGPPQVADTLNLEAMSVLEPLWPRPRVGAELGGDHVACLLFREQGAAWGVCDCD